MAKVCHGMLNYVDIKKNLLPEVGEVPKELLWQALQLVVVNVEPLKHKKKKYFTLKMSTPSTCCNYRGTFGTPTDLQERGGGDG